MGASNALSLEMEEEAHLEMIEELRDTDPDQWALNYASPLESSLYFGVRDDRPPHQIYEEDRMWHQGHHVLLRCPARHLL